MGVRVQTWVLGCRRGCWGADAGIGVQTSMHRIWGLRALTCVLGCRPRYWGVGCARLAALRAPAAALSLAAATPAAATPAMDDVGDVGDMGAAMGRTDPCTL